MPKCINDHTRTYKGNEPSPKGFGLCSHAENKFSLAKGTDNNIWLNNGNRWVKFNHNKVLTYKSLFCHMNKFQKNNLYLLLNQVVETLNTHNIKAFTYVWCHNIDNVYIINDPWDYVYDLEDIDFDKEPFIIIVFKVNNGKINTNINIQHNNIIYKNKINLKEIFKKYFGDKFHWDGKITSTINIDL